jgi:hypothetical protein
MPLRKIQTPGFSMFGLKNFFIALFLILLLATLTKPAHPVDGPRPSPISPEGFWGKDWPDILQFYYPHTHSEDGEWFNKEKNCCGGKDCLPARPSTVRWTPEGYRVVMPDGGYAIIPEEQSKEIPQDVKEVRATVCLYRSSFTKGFTETHTGNRYVQTKYRVRGQCFWHGKPRI